MTATLNKRTPKDKTMEHLSAAPKPIKIPGPDHPITIERNPNRVVVSAAGRVVADSLDALTLREASYEPVQYIPRKDVDMTLLARVGHTTYCPYKGDCAHYSIPAGGGSVRSTLSGPMRPLTRRWQPSRTTLPSTPTASTRSRNGRAASCPSLKTAGWPLRQ